MTYCTHCGTKREGEGKYCGGCGAAFGAAPTAPEPEPQPEPPSPWEKRYWIDSVPPQPEPEPRPEPTAEPEPEAPRSKPSRWGWIPPVAMIVVGCLLATQRWVFLRPTKGLVFIEDPLCRNIIYIIIGSLIAVLGAVAIRRRCVSADGGKGSVSALVWAIVGLVVCGVLFTSIVKWNYWHIIRGNPFSNDDPSLNVMAYTAIGSVIAAVGVVALGLRGASDRPDRDASQAMMWLVTGLVWCGVKYIPLSQVFMWNPLGSIIIYLIGLGLGIFVFCRLKWYGLPRIRALGAVLVWGWVLYLAIWGTSFVLPPYIVHKYDTAIYKYVLDPLHLFVYTIIVVFGVWAITRLRSRSRMIRFPAVYSIFGIVVLTTFYVWWFREFFKYVI